MLKRLTNFAKENKFFFLILLLASSLRFVAIDEVPPSLNWDEVSHGYNAYSILRTGKDEWGNVFPTIFRAYGDYKLPVYIYITAISEFFFGLNAFAVRLPSVLAGIGTVVFTYLLVKELFNDRGKMLNFTQKNAERVALVSSLLVALEPWSLFLSRGAFEANLALFLIISGVYFFLKGLRVTNYLLPATTLMGLSVWTYNSARIFVPILIAVLFLIYKNELLKIFKKDKQSLLLRNKKLTTYYLLLTTLFFVPMFWQLLHPVGQARYGEVAIIDGGAISQIIEARNESTFNPVITRLIYNRPTYFLQRFIENWASHFTCSFLFFKGGSNYQFSIPAHGLIYPINGMFFFIGLIYLLFKLKKKEKISILLLSWLLLAPIPSSLTREAPHVLRSIVILPIPMIITAIGVTKIIEWFKNSRFKIQSSKLLYALYLFILAGFVESYLNIYFTEYKRNYSWSWQYGYKEAVDYVKQNYDKYNKIIVTKKYGEPHEFFLFYWPWDPERYRDDPNLIRFNQSNWYWVDRFDKIYFVNDWDIPKEEWEPFVLESGGSVQCLAGSVRCLLITSPGNYPKTWNKLDTINFFDSKPVFEIYEN